MIPRVHRLWIGLFCVQSMILVIFSYSIYFQMQLCVLFMVQASQPYVAFGNKRVHIIRNFILLYVAFLSFTMSISVLDAVASFCLIYYVPYPPASNY